MKKYFLFIITFIYVLSINSILFSQESKSSFVIETATEYMSKIVDTYRGFVDVKAKVEIMNGSSKMYGTIFIKQDQVTAPKFRINFTSPRGQVITSDGLDFFVYIPSQNVVLHQKKYDFTNNAGSLLSMKGLSQLSKNYLITYLDNPNFTPFEHDTSKRVKTLKLKWNNIGQNFRQIILYVDADNVILKVDAITYNRESVQFVFSDFEVNNGIPDSRFDYKPPPTAHVREKFLFDEQKEVTTDD